VLKRLSHLEQLLQERSDRRLAASTSLPSVTPGVSDSTTSSDKREQDLQAELLELDIIAAEAEIELARINWERSTQANKKQPGTASELLVEQQRAELVTKKVQLQRAKTLLQLHKRQVERRREEAARQNEPLDSSARKRKGPIAGTHQRAMRADELARLKKLTGQISEQIRRVEQIMKEKPDSPESWEAIDKFLAIYGNLSNREANREGPSTRESAGTR
jgi:hypothetical protein